MYTEKSVRVSFVGAGDVLQHIVCAKESKYGMLVGDEFTLEVPIGITV